MSPMIPPPIITSSCLSSFIYRDLLFLCMSYFCRGAIYRVHVLHPSGCRDAIYRVLVGSRHLVVQLPRNRLLPYLREDVEFCTLYDEIFPFQSTGQNTVMQPYPRVILHGQLVGAIAMCGATFEEGLSCKIAEQDQIKPTSPS